METIGVVNPIDSRFYAQLMLNQNNFGKIKLNQKVELRFDAYPYQEFGVIQGKMRYISKVPSDSGFLAIAELPNGLTTNFNKQIQYRNGLKCQALIVTRELGCYKSFTITFQKTFRGDREQGV